MILQRQLLETVLPPLKRRKKLYKFFEDNQFKQKSRISNFSPKKTPKIKQKSNAFPTQKQLLYDIQNIDQYINNDMSNINKFLFSSVINQKAIKSILYQLSNCSTLIYDSLLNSSHSKRQSTASIFQKNNVKSALSHKSQIKTLVSKNIQNSYVYHRLNTLQNLQKTGLKTLQNEQNKFYKINRKEQILQFIKQNKDNLLLIWNPPIGYPQFVGFVVYDKFLKKAINGQTKIILKNAYIKDSLPKTSKKIFDQIQLYLSKKYEEQIGLMQITTNGEIYRQKYRKWGWNLKCVHNHKFKLWYKNQNN